MAATATGLTTPMQDDPEAGMVDDTKALIDTDTEPNPMTKKFLDKFAKLIPWLFVILGLGILTFWIIGFVTDTWTIWIILLISLVGSALGVWAVYQFGVIQDQIDRLKVQNQEYESQIDQLRSTREKLEGEVTELQKHVDNLKQNSAELETQLEAFDELKQGLEAIAGDNQELANMLDDTNKIFDDMRQTMLENTRAQLLSAFYDAAFRDDDQTMNKREWKRFLAKLTKAERAQFNALGTFEELAGDDLEIDLEEFQAMIEKILVNVDERLKEELADS